MQVILTGLRANGELTLGNYLGAILPMLNLAKSHSENHQVNMFVPDLHSFTTPIDHSELLANITHNLKLFVASGLPINHPNIHIYRQSYIPAHSELTWILGCFTGFGELGRMVEFKDKSQQVGDDRVTAGLFNYPVLMAADILLYGAKWVPLGEDQRQHIELARTLGQRLNSKFGDIFTIPEPFAKQAKFAGLDNALRVRSLRNPSKKMSKSIADPSGTILLTDEPAKAAKKVMSATTDSLANINFDWLNQPGVTNLLQLLSLLSDTPQQAINAQWQGKTNYGDLKKEVANLVESLLSRLQSNYSTVNETELFTKLRDSEQLMNQIANAQLLKIQQAIGLRA